MSLINIIDVSFAYDGSYDEVFSHVSFSIDTNWKLGFCGRNGRGKTTFLRMLMGELEYTGTITSNVMFEYFPYPVQDETVNTIDVLHMVVPETLEWQMYRELSLLSIDEGVLYRPFHTLSNGERTKVLLAGLFLRENSFLLIDEPTNHIDNEARETIASYLNKKSGFILVSHDRKLLDACTDHTLSINKQDIQVMKGNFSTWYEQKQKQDAYELAQNEKLSKEINRLEASVKRTANWSDNAEKKKRGKAAGDVDVKHGWAPKQAAKAKKMMARSKAIQNRKEASIEEKSLLLHNIESVDTLKLYPLQYSGSLVRFDKVGVFYGDSNIVENISFSIQSGDRIALQGANGTGKSSLIKLIVGNSNNQGTDIDHDIVLDTTESSKKNRHSVLRFTGDISVASRMIISYVPQDASYLSGSLTDFAKNHSIDETLLKTLLRKLDLNREQFDKNIEEYSAGQKKKVLLAGSLASKAHLYIWDEPLNYIDVLSRIQIEQLILEYKPTLLFVEHDGTFVENVATQVLAL